MGHTGRPHVALKAFQKTSTREIRIIERRELSMPKLALVVDGITVHGMAQ